VTEIPHPSNVTDQDQQRNHYFRQIAEQLARIADAMEPSASPSTVPPAVNMTDRAQLQTYNLRQVAIQLARIADRLEPSTTAPRKRPSRKKPLKPA